MLAVVVRIRLALLREQQARVVEVRLQALGDGLRNVRRLAPGPDSLADVRDQSFECHASYSLLYRHSLPLPTLWNGTILCSQESSRQRDQRVACALDAGKGCDMPASAVLEWYRRPVRSALLTAALMLAVTGCG